MKRTVYLRQDLHKRCSGRFGVRDFPSRLRFKDSCVRETEMAIKKNLVFVCPSLGESSEVWMWRQLRRFKRMNPHLLTWAYNNEATYPIDGIPVKRMSGYRTMPANGAGRWRYRLRCLPQMNFYATVGSEKKELIRWVKGIRPDVVLGQFGFMALRILPVAKALQLPVVAHFHGYDLSSGLNNRWYRWSLLPALQHFSAIVVVGSHQKRWMLDHGIPESKVHLIPCGVPTDEFLPKHYDSSEGGIISFIAVSRLVEKKGFEYTLRAFSIVCSELPDVELDIYGDGPLREKVKQLARDLSVDNKVTFHGAVSAGIIRSSMKESDIFVQHSVAAASGDQEGFGVSVAEASASCLPIVCSDATGIVDQVVDGETGYLIPQKDVDAMAEKMLFLARDARLRRKMGRAGRQRMVDCFDAGKQVAKLEKVLTNCTKD